MVAASVPGVAASGLSVAVAYVPGGGKHATTLNLLYSVDAERSLIRGGDPDFGHATPVIFAGQTVGPFVAGQTAITSPLPHVSRAMNFKTRGSNSVNPSVEGAVVTIVIT